MNEKFKNLLLWFIITAIMISVFSNFGPKPHASNELPYSQFIQKVSQGEVKHVTIQGQKITGESTTAQPFISYMPMPDNYLLGELIKQNVSVKGTPPERRSLLMTIFLNWFPMPSEVNGWPNLVINQVASPVSDRSIISSSAGSIGTDTETGFRSLFFD